MPVYKIVVAYDGTDYRGWQEQAQGSTVAGTLKRTFQHVFKQDIALLGASRTDAGVHAFGQVASVRSALVLGPERLKIAWNGKLPRDITIREVSHVDDAYNPHHFVAEKEYIYTVAIERPLPFQARYQWFYRGHITLDKLMEALTIFVGIHDFRSFCCSEYTGDTVRTINSITINHQSPTVFAITFKAPGFLRYMIRRLVGASLNIASHYHLSVDYLASILHAKNPEHTLENAPPHGLVLQAIYYHVPHANSTNNTP